MKKAGSTYVTIPSDLLPDVIELVTDAYVKAQDVIAKKEQAISTLQFDNAELRRKNIYLQSVIDTTCSVPPAREGKRPEANDGDDF